MDGIKISKLHEKFSDWAVKQPEPQSPNDLDEEAAFNGGWLQCESEMLGEMAKLRNILDGISEVVDSIDLTQFQMLIVIDALLNSLVPLTDKEIMTGQGIWDAYVAVKLKEPTPMPKYGNLMTVEEFRHECRSGGIMNSDGCGYYANPPNYYHGISARPSDMVVGRILEGFTHVAWFNK
jgi:hypothetical protein